MIKIKQTTTLIIILLISIFTLYSQDQKTNNEKKSPTDVCIIYAKSKYKLALTDAIENRLIKENFNVIKDQLKNINNYDPANYAVVVILSGVVAFTPYPKATMYIKKNNYAKNIIYFCAAFIESTVFGFLDGDRIDAITAASDLDNIEKTADEIIKEIHVIIGNSI